jgi:hypothetical protein
MRSALVFVLLLAGCVVEHRGPANLQVIAPRQLDRASISVDGQQASALTIGDPVIDIVRQLMGHKRPFVTGIAHVGKGAHTLRIAKPGFEPVERTVDISDGPVVIQICAADVRPVK